MREHELDVVQIRLIKERTLYSDHAMNSPKEVIRFLADEFSAFDREVLGILNLNSQNQVINMNVVTVGTIDQSIVSPREIFKSSILSNAANIILIHNHPSGKVSPSREDMQITDQLCSAGMLLGIHVLDHVIIGGRNGWSYSFAEHGDLKAGCVIKRNESRRLRL